MHQAGSFFSADVRLTIAKQLGINAIGVSSIQSAIRTLLKKGFIGRSMKRGAYFIDDPNFKKWLEH